MSSNKKRTHEQVGGEAPASTEPSEGERAIKRVTVAAPENPTPAPDDRVANPGSNRNIPWGGLLRPLSLINAVHLESVSAQFQKFVFTGQHRLVWNFKFRNCLAINHGLSLVDAHVRNLALLFLVTKIGPFCRQLILKEFQHPQNPLDTLIFAYLPILESVFLKYGQPERMQGDLTFGCMSESFLTFLANAQTTLPALGNTDKAEIRIHVNARSCPKNLLGLPALGRALNAFSDFLSQRSNSLISLQLAPFEKYSRRTGQGSIFQLDLTKLELPDERFHLRKLRVVFTREKPDNYNQALQYTDYLKTIIGHLETLYIKWEEDGHFNLHAKEYTFLNAFYPIWTKRIFGHTVPIPIPLRALAIDFNWVNVSFENEELHSTLFDRHWKYLGERLGKMLSEDRFRKLSLTLPASPNRQGQGCFYFSEAFIQEFVQNRSLDYLRLVFSKAMPGVPLKFGLVRLGTLEISFSCLKECQFSWELVQAAQNALFDLECDFWKSSHFAASVRSLKLKYAPYFDENLAKHLATAFPNLVMFSFTAFHENVYNQGDFLRGLRMLLERIYSLRVIKLGDSFNKNGVDLFPLLRDLQARANNDTRRFVFYARKATVDERSQTILDNSRRVGSNLRITVETFPRIQVQGEMHREFPPVMDPQFPNEGLQSSPSLPGNRPEYSDVGIYQQTPPQLFPNQPTVATSRAPLPEGFSGLDDYSLTPSGSLPRQNLNLVPNVQPVANIPNQWLQSRHSAPLYFSQNASGRNYQQTSLRPSPQLFSNPPVVSSGVPLPGGVPQEQLHWACFDNWHLPTSSPGSSNAPPSDYISHQNFNFPPNIQPAAYVPATQPTYQFQGFRQPQPQFPVELPQNAPALTYQQTPPQAVPQRFPIQRGPAVASRLTLFQGGLPQNQPNMSAFYNWPQPSQGNPNMTPSSYIPHQNLLQNVHPSANIPGTQPTHSFLAQQAANHQQLQNAPLHWSPNAPGLPYQQPQPHLVPLPPSPTVSSSSRAPSPGGYDHLGLANINVINNDFSPNVQHAANIPSNQPNYPFPVQQAANQLQPSPPPAAELAAEEDDFAMMMAQINKDAKG